MSENKGGYQLTSGACRGGEVVEKQGGSPYRGGW